MKTHLPQQKNPTLKDYEKIFASSEDAASFTNIISDMFPDYIRNKNFEANIYSDRKSSNQNNFNSDDGSAFQKELTSQQSFLKTLKQTLYPYSDFDDTGNNEKLPMTNDSTNLNPIPSKFNNFVKVEVVDAVVDSNILSTLLPLASNQKKNSKFLLDTIKEKKISSVSKEIVESEKVQNLAQKRIFLLSIGKLRLTPEEAEKKKKMRFISASKLNLKSILKNPNPQPSINLDLVLRDPNKNHSNIDDIHIITSQSNRTNKTDLNVQNNNTNQNTKNTQRRVHFVPEKDDIIPTNAVIFDYKESARIMKKAREEERAIRKREEEFMKKVKTDFMTKQKTTKNKHSNASALDFNISLKPKPKPRSRSAKTKSKTKTTNLSSSLYPSYYSPKTKSSSGTASHPTEKDDRIRRKTTIRSNSPQVVSFRSQYDENSNVIRRGKSSGLNEKPKAKPPKPKQVKSRPRTGYEY